NYVERYSRSKNVRRERSLSVAALHGKAMMVFVRDRSGSRHRGPVESADGRGAHAVLPGDYGGPAGGGVRGIAGLWPLLPPSPPGAGGTEPPHGANDPDPGESRPHLYRGEGVPG